MEKPEALRLAHELDAIPETGADPDLIQEAAAELRRLHEANEAFGQRQEWWNEKMFALEVRRDVLLEALKLARLMLHAHAERHAKIEAAIKAAKEQK